MPIVRARSFQYQIRLARFPVNGTACAAGTIADLGILSPDVAGAAIGKAKADREPLLNADAGKLDRRSSKMKSPTMSTQLARACGPLPCWSD
jgi:hypothetical protein